MIRGTYGKALSVVYILALTGAWIQVSGKESPVNTHYDSLQTDIQSGESFNLAIFVIKGWQQISFSTPLFNCPFDPCCSNYAIHSFSHKGFLKGLLYTADRISRCHPFVYKYYPEKYGRLMNEVPSKSYFKSGHVPYLTIPISLIIPGFNKMVNGRFFDGMFMFLITEISAYGAYTNYKNDNYFYLPLTFIFFSFYLSDIYFNFLSL